MRARMHGWSLVELLVVLSIAAILIGILLPALAGSRQVARQVNCLANLRSLGQAHAVYLNESAGRLLEDSHGSGLSWIETLRDYDPSLLLRSPLDTSPHFAGGVPIAGQFRQASYALNRYVSPSFIAGVSHIDEVPRPSATVQMVIKRYEVPGNPSDPAPVSDHVHPDLWDPGGAIPPAVRAASEAQTHAYAGEQAQDSAVSGYAYLDGHAAAEAFSVVFVTRDTNRFNPAVAR
ncbi:MAG: prepilin-type N-terminal cleavage/methylation domain-containing protein [Planctomycetota bacterium]